MLPGPGKGVMFLAGPSESESEVQWSGPAALPSLPIPWDIHEATCSPTGRYLTVFMQLQDKMQLPVGRHVLFQFLEKTKNCLRFILIFTDPV